MRLGEGEEKGRCKRNGGSAGGFFLVHVFRFSLG